MATIGQVLAAPEAGWKRIAPNDPMFSRTGTWATISYNNVAGSALLFSFRGTKLRVIGVRGYDASSSIDLYIDEVKVTSFSQHTSSGWTNMVLNIDLQDLENTEHTVKIVNNAISGNRWYYFNAIDLEDIAVPPSTLTAVGGDSQITLHWSAATGATGYNVKRATTAGGPYETIAANVYDTGYVDNGVVNGTTYYYIVTAITAGGEGEKSNEASATPVAAPGEDRQAILRITMNDSSEREYKVSKTIADDFVNWCNRTLGTGNSCYVFDKGIQNSIEYLLYEKIISFEVIPVAE
jgi:hypothetical protein